MGEPLFVVYVLFLNQTWNERWVVKYYSLMPCPTIKHRGRCSSVVKLEAEALSSFKDDHLFTFFFYPNQPNIYVFAALNVKYFFNNILTLWSVLFLAIPANAFPASSEMENKEKKED